MSDEVDLLHEGKHESLLQIDSMGMVKNSQSFANSKFAKSLQYLEKKLKLKFTHKRLLQHFEHQSFLQG